MQFLKHGIQSFSKIFQNFLRVIDKRFSLTSKKIEWIESNPRESSEKF